MKNWFLNAGIAFSCGVGLAIILSSGNPLLIGLQTAVAALLSTTAVLILDRQRQQQIVRRWQGRISQLQATAQQLQQKLDGGVDQKDRLLMQIMNHQQQVSALDAARRRMTEEAQQLAEQLAILQAEKLQIQQSMDRTAINHRQLQEGKMELAAKIDSQAEDRQSLLAELENMRSEQQQLLAGVTDLKIERGQIAQEIAQQQSLVNELEMARSEYRQLQAQIVLLTAQHQEAEQRLASRQAVVSELEIMRAEQQQLQEQVVELQTERDQLEQQLDAHQTQISAVQEQETKLQQSLQHLQTQITEMNIVQSQVAELHQERQQLEQSIDWLKSDLEQMIDRSQGETQELQEREAELQASVQNLQRQAAEFGNLQEQIDTLYKEWQQVDETVKQLKTEEEEAIGRTQELQERQQALLDRERELQAQQRAMLDRERELRESLEQLTAHQQARQAEIALLQPAWQSLQQSSQQLGLEVAHLTARKTQLQQDLLELQRQHQRQRHWPAGQQSSLETDWNEPWAETEDFAPPRATALSGIPLEVEPSTEKPWPENLEDEYVRAVFVHLHKYGSLTEAELTQMLEGNPRKARQFALKFEEYLAKVPFSARVEVAASGKRYVRE